MRFNVSIKRAICFLLAVLMLFSVVGCKEKKKNNKKKVVIREQIVVRDNDDDNESTNSVVDDSSKPIVDEADDDEVANRVKRPLLKAEEEEEVIPYDTIHKEEFTPEFEYKNVDFAGNLADYVIVYSSEKDKNGAPTSARVLAEKLSVFFKDNDNVSIPVKDDKTVEGNEKMIIVGDTAYYKSSLSEQEFAVNIKGDNIVFEGGHIVMVEKAVDWFRTVKREAGKIATLTGRQDNFTSTISLEKYDKELVYVWGDEFDGEESVDNSKWIIGVTMPQYTDLEYLKTKDVCYVENGRLRMTAIQYLSEDNPDIAYASCGSYDTTETMAYKHGYTEVTAKISYTKGIIMPMWLMSNPDGGMYIPREQFGAAWYSEVDIFETFGNGNQWDVSFHKYYKPYDVAYNGGRVSNGLVHTTTDDDGAPCKKTLFWGEPVYYEKNGEILINKFDATGILNDGWAAWGFITSWRKAYDSEENKKQQYVFTGEVLETLNDSYHRYGYLSTEEGYKMYIDGECWLERDWDVAWDSKEGYDFNNNNGWGYNLFYYLILNQHPYTPMSNNPPEKIIENPDIPISTFIDSVRIYQAKDDISIFAKGYTE